MATQSCGVAVIPSSFETPESLPSIVEPRVNYSKDEKKLFLQLQAQSPCTEGQESQTLHTINLSALTCSLAAFTYFVEEYREKWKVRRSMN